MSPLNTIKPVFWLALLVWTLLVAGGGMAYGYNEAREAAELDKAKAVKLAMERQATADAEVLADERALRKLDRETFDTYKKGIEHAEIETDRVISGLRRDVIRLRVPTRHRCPAPDAGGSPADGTGEEGHAELSADASEFVVGLLARGDSAIRAHGAVVDLYENLRQACMRGDHSSTAPMAPTIENKP